MNAIIRTLFLIIISVTSLNATAQKQSTFKPKEVYRSSGLIITQIAENSFQHTSYLQTNDFGNVPCNGLFVRNINETIIFDTPADDRSSEELISWIIDSLHCRINAIIPTHFHNDCLGGLPAFHEKNIPSYAYFKTIEFAKTNNFAIPQNGFHDSLVLKVGNQHIVAKFFGEGHTRDNIVGYFPTDNILFGGCLIKEINASKGFLGDANIAAWPGTVENVKKAYPQVKIIIPGHGKFGNTQLLDYTINLFKAR